MKTYSNYVCMAELAQV